MSEIAKIELSKDLIEPIVRAQLQASIVSAMGKADQMVAQVVNTVLNSNVDNNGDPVRYSSGGGTPLITWIANDAIKKAALEAVQEWFADNREEMKKHLRLAIKNNAKGMAEAFVLSMSKAAECTYSTKIEVLVNKR